MVHHIETGKKGEEIAENYLQNRGYTILGRNVRTVGGEVDIIAKQGEIIVFVEVKAKTRKDSVQPTFRVNPAKVARLSRAAELWLEAELNRGAPEMPARIDVIGVCEGKVVEHYEDVTA